MTAWNSRSREEQSLLNPAFHAMLVWKAAESYNAEGDSLLSLEEAFLLAPIVLHKGTRDVLPSTVRTSLAVWSQEHPLERGGVAIRASRLSAYTKEALLFAGVHGLISFQDSRIEAAESFKKQINRALRDATEEVSECAKKAAFVGKWFSQSGGPATVLALFGVRP